MPCSDNGQAAEYAAEQESQQRRKATELTKKLDIVTQHLCFVMRWLFKNKLNETINNHELIVWFEKHKNADERRVLAKVKKLLDPDDFEVVMSLGERGVRE